MVSLSNLIIKNEKIPDATQYPTPGSPAAHLERRYREKQGGKGSVADQHQVSGGKGNYQENTKRRAKQHTV